MILKGSQRGGGQNLAVHLMRLDDNEHIELHELRGFASDNLKDAFKEAEGVSRGTKCRQYLFSLSLSPPTGQAVPVSVFQSTIETIEQRLGLEGQPRAVVFHEKEGRRHAHCVWSRIDAETMTARPLAFFKTKLMDVSKSLYLDHGWKMPKGFVDSAQRDPTNFTLAEWQQAKRQGVDPRWSKAVLQECWKASDGRKAFEAAIERHGYFLAAGTDRPNVVVDHDGKAHSLSRMLGLRLKDLKSFEARLGPDNLRTVKETQKMIAERMTPAIRRHIQESRGAFRDRSAKLGEYKAEMTQLHRQGRSKLNERLAGEWEEENRQRAARLPKGLRGLWHRITGRYQEVRAANEAEARETRERQARERQRLIEKQLEQRAVLQAQFKELRRNQARQLRELRTDVGRYLRLSRGTERQSKGKDQSLGLKLQR